MRHHLRRSRQSKSGWDRRTIEKPGGVVVSYFEWVQAQQAYWWTEAEIESRLEQRMLQAFESVSAMARREDVSLRDAALLLSVQRVAQAHEIRGLYP